MAGRLRLGTTAAWRRGIGVARCVAAAWLRGIGVARWRRCTAAVPCRNGVVARLHWHCQCDVVAGAGRIEVGVGIVGAAESCSAATTSATASATRQLAKDIFPLKIFSIFTPGYSHQPGLKIFSRYF
uniref:Uncharacterized protein n=1 Tax=Oryza sativa subsp. japonica TaxID=39947 RepID=Q2QU69_ORYSJ|nr:hypothetical protein LOC_Os12g17280 [Oryza sativa Japonica Group]